MQIQRGGAVHLPMSVHLCDIFASNISVHTLDVLTVAPGDALISPAVWIRCLQSRMCYGEFP